MKAVPGLDEVLTMSFPFVNGSSSLFLHSVPFSRNPEDGFLFRLVVVLGLHVSFSPPQAAVSPRPYRFPSFPNSLFEDFPFRGSPWRHECTGEASSSRETRLSWEFSAPDRRLSSGRRARFGWVGAGPQERRAPTKNKPPRPHPPPPSKQPPPTTRQPSSSRTLFQLSFFVASPPDRLVILF